MRKQIENKNGFADLKASLKDCEPEDKFIDIGGSKRDRSSFTVLNFINKKKGRNRSSAQKKRRRRINHSNERKNRNANVCKMSTTH